jgi:hypothetical protein
MVLDYGEAIRINCVSEEHEYISAHPCPICGGRWRVRMQALLADSQGHHYDRVDVICRQCRRRQAFLFDIDRFFQSSQD